MVPPTTININAVFTHTEVSSSDSSNYQHLDTIKEVKKEKKQRKKEGMKRRDEGSYGEREERSSL